jgi:cytoskeletal protein CcmA (bactofilin family)
MKIMSMPTPTTTASTSQAGFKFNQNQGVTNLRPMSKDTISFGMAFGDLPSVNIKEGDYYSSLENEHYKEFNVGGNVNVKNLTVDGTLTTGGNLNAFSANAKNINVRKDAHVNNITAEETLTIDNFLTTDSAKAKTINVGCSASVKKNITAEETLTTGGNLNADSAKAKTINVGKDAHVKNITAEETLTIDNFLATDSAEAKTINVGWSAYVKNITAEETLTTGWLDADSAKAKTINVGKDAKVRRIVDAEKMMVKGHAEFGDINKLDELFLLNYLDSDERNLSRKLTFKSLDKFPEKIKVALGDKISEFVIATPDGGNSILKKFEFFEAIVNTDEKGKEVVTMGKRIADDVIKRAVQVVKIVK